MTWRCRLRGLVEIWVYILKTGNMKSERGIVFEMDRKKSWRMENSIIIQSTDFWAEDSIHMVIQLIQKLLSARSLSNDEKYIIIKILYFVFNGNIMKSNLSCKFILKSCTSCNGFTSVWNCFIHPSELDHILKSLTTTYSEEVKWF